MNNRDLVIRRKKLIEVSIPLDLINASSALEKQPGIGTHPRSLHLWWARRPLSAARAVIFCQTVDDPSSIPEEFPTKVEQEKERLRLFLVLQNLLDWKNFNNFEVLEKGREEILRSWKRCCEDNKNHPDSAEIFIPSKIPDFHDPFAGGGALPLEAQRLGLKSYASDLNPVAVLINKTMIEIPPEFNNIPSLCSSLNFKNNLLEKDFTGAKGLADDIRFYGEWMQNEAEKLIGNFFPSITIDNEIIEQHEELKGYRNKKLDILSWIWVRTINSPNPAFRNIKVPLASSFLLCTKKGKQFYVEPIVIEKSIKFIVKSGQPKNFKEIKNGTKLSRNTFRCLISGDLISSDYIKAESLEGRLENKLMAIVCKGPRGRIYLSPTNSQEVIAENVFAKWDLEQTMNRQTTDLVSGRGYGFFKWSELFTKRQLLALCTFSDLLVKVKNKIEIDLNKLADKEKYQLFKNSESTSSITYQDAVVTYLSFAISRLADYNSSITTWKPSGEQVMQTFKRQAIPMTWDFPESNILGNNSICWKNCIKYIADNLDNISSEKCSPGSATQADAQTQNISRDKIVSTDPPYFDNIIYSDLSDFFYIWLRNNLKEIYPGLFGTMYVPKVDELVAAKYRHESTEQAEEFFLNGMKKALMQLANNAHPAFPITIYYAFKQTESKSSTGNSRTGWETFLSALLEAGLSISGAWPMRTELSNRIISSGTNALSSSIVLVCSKKKPTNKIISRKEFRRLLRNSLPTELYELVKSNIAPVDIAQAALGPGMAIFSQLKAVVKNDDTEMGVKEILEEINLARDEYLSKDENEYDVYTLFALTFFESYQYLERDFGEAEGLAKARNIPVEEVAKAGIITAVGGKVKLIEREAYEDDWDPLKDNILCIWEATQHLIKRLEQKGEEEASKLLHALNNIPGHQNLSSSCRSLAYRLFNHCEKNNLSEEARSYNGLIIAWPDIERTAAEEKIQPTIQTKLI